MLLIVQTGAAACTFTKWPHVLDVFAWRESHKLRKIGIIFLGGLLVLLLTLVFPVCKPRQKKQTSQVHPATQFPHTNAPDKQDTRSCTQVFPNKLFQLSSPIRTQPRANTKNIPRRRRKQTSQVHPATQFPNTKAPDKQDIGSWEALGYERSQPAASLLEKQC